MTIPTRFKYLLSQDNSLNGLVLNILSTIEVWTIDNKTVFFPEYTDHSLRHLEEVLLTAEGLILDEAWPHLTAADASLIVLAVLFHDCALHISEDGFFHLISENYRSPDSNYIKKEEGWQMLWQNFLAEAKRFDQRRLLNLFGDTSPITSIPCNKLDLTHKHKLLIGEFLRRHHARLAHEIAISGIPGPKTNLKLTDSANPKFMDLAGFVARSHNMDLRSAVDLLESHARRIHFNSKVPFIMAALRISDYLQIQAPRAPGKLLQLKSLSSPISREEWKKHLAVKELHQAHDDPEAIFVDVNPESAKTFLAIKNLLKDMQLELDKSWAVIGEIYGRFEPFSKLGIGIRRIKSNIDDANEFQRVRNPPYIARDFRFKAASAELMDLLVSPLYGDRPEVGIREIIQNAVDACLERDDLISKGLASKIERPKEDVKVELKKLDNEDWFIVVEDFGVGMTADVVDKYFLNVGASFRGSDLWRKNHEVEGHSTVHRTGRFGIGLLAAFLLGGKIKITTRHINESADKAITFTCTQGSESLEVAHCSFHCGTKIEIPLKKEVVQKLISYPFFWDWYCLSKPSVVRSIENNKITILKQSRIVPACNAELGGSNWNRVIAEGFDDIIWSYKKSLDDRNAESSIVCNGIYICHTSHNGGCRVSSPLNIIHPDGPNLVVYDPDGRFPINLQRDSVSYGHISFQKELNNSLADYFAEKFIESFAALKAELNGKNISFSINPKIPGLGHAGYDRHGLSYVIFNKKGFVPSDADLIEKSEISSIFIDAIDASTEKGAFNSVAVKDWVENYSAVSNITSTKSSRSYFLRAAAGDAYYGFYFKGLNIIGRRIFVRQSTISELVGAGGIPKRVFSGYVAEKKIKDWILYKAGKVPAFDLNLEKVADDLEKNGAFGFAIVYIIPRDEKDLVVSPFAEAWMRKNNSFAIGGCRS